MAIELDLDEILDRHNARLEARGDLPFESVWEALEELTDRYPLAVIRVLLRAALPDVPEIPPQILQIPELGDRLTEAIAVAFGSDPAELVEEDDATGPPEAGDDAGGSTG